MDKPQQGQAGFSLIISMMRDVVNISLSNGIPNALVLSSIPCLIIDALTLRGCNSRLSFSFLACSPAYRSAYNSRRRGAILSWLARFHSRIYAWRQTRQTGLSPARQALLGGKNSSVAGFCSLHSVHSLLVVCTMRLLYITMPAWGNEVKSDIQIQAVTA